MKIKKFEELIGRFQQADRMLREGHHREAIRHLIQLQAELDASGVESGCVLWSLAVAHDGLGQLESAYTFIEQALRQDPLALPMRHSRQVILTHIQKMVIENAAPDNKVGMLALYDLLVRVREATPDVHLAIAQMHLELGALDQAERIIAAVLVVSPSSVAWCLRAGLLRARGDHDGALVAEAEASVACGSEIDPALIANSPWATA